MEKEINHVHVYANCPKFKCHQVLSNILGVDLYHLNCTLFTVLNICEISNMLTRDNMLVKTPCYCNV